MYKSLLTLSLMTMICGTAAYAADTSKTNSDYPSHSQVSMETRQKMASLHEKMAACLRSDKTVSECRTEMRDSCQNMLGRENCQMMHSMGSAGTAGGIKSNHDKHDVDVE